MIETATKERPILFSGPMVRAILDGRKTVTRRVVKKQPPALSPGWEWAVHQHPDAAFGWYAERYHDGGFDEEGGVEEQLWEKTHCPYGQPGDRIWVREAFSAWFGGEHWYGIHRDDRLHVQCSNVFYRATHNFPDDDQKWVPGIFMPRWASRLTLEIVSVSVERLQEVESADIRLEGFDCPIHDFGSGMCVGYCKAIEEEFRETWDALNKSRGYGWDSNPWVWRVEFRRARG